MSIRRLLLTMSPFIVFGALYLLMGLFPSYEYRPVDIRGLYDVERALFGVTLADGSVLTPNEWFCAHTSATADILAGVFYLCWVPLPLLFAFWLFFTGRQVMCFRFASAFLLVNLLGFAVYYIHPAAPPWYVMKHGFNLVVPTPGDVAGLSRFDELVGVPVFGTIYSGNSNVFAALPSLHAAYCPVACFYAMKAHERAWTVLLAVVSAGIWWTAVYTCHHYAVDVLLGIATAIVGLTLYESLLMRWSPWRTAFDKFTNKLIVNPKI